MSCAAFRKDATHRIVIQQLNNVADNYGAFSSNWVEKSTVWASIQPLSGAEIYRQDMNQSRVKSKMIIRYDADLKNTSDTAAFRVFYDERIFPIKYVSNVADDMKAEGKSFQILYCEENAAGEQ